MEPTTREFVSQRAGSRCEYCHLPEEADEWPFHLEHIVARQHGGIDALDNLCWACSRCNLYKGPNRSTIDPVSHRRVDLFDPRADTWNEHFILQVPQIVGITPTGRATAALLRMNDGRRIELRAALIRRVEFPA